MKFAFIGSTGEFGNGCVRRSVSRAPAFMPGGQVPERTGESRCGTHGQGAG